MSEEASAGKTSRPRKRKNERELERHIRDLIERAGGGANEDLVADMIGNALKILRDVESRGDVRLIQTAIRELRYSHKLFAPYWQQRKVSIFGSARTKGNKAEYQSAVEFGRKIVDAGFMVITGAGPGIMQAGHEGAGPEHSFGANIRLPWEQTANSVIHSDKKLITFKYFFTRKLTFIRQSDAVVLYPGGFGTLDEGFEALTLMQTGKSRLRPLVLIDRPGGTYWKSWDRYVRDHLLRDGLISAEDLNLFHMTDDADDAVRVVTRFYRNFHSSRYVRGRLVIRLNHAPTETAVAALNEDFRDIVSDVKISVVEPSPDEIEDDDAVDKPRIAFGFNRQNQGRLRKMIDVLNSL